MAVFFTRRGAAAALVGGKMLGDYVVGESVFLNESGSPVEYLVVHQGSPDTTLYDSSCEGAWLLRKGIYASREWHSKNSNIYASSTIHTYLNDTFVALFDNATQSAIQQVKIPYVNGDGYGGSVASGYSGLSAKIFLLSGYEVGFTTSVNSYFPLDGAKLAYFESGDTSGGTNRSLRIARLNNTATAWGLRSPHRANTTGAWEVSANGGCEGYILCSATTGIRPALIMPITALFDPGTNTFISAS